MDANKFMEFYKIPLDDGEFLYPLIIDLSQDNRNYPIEEVFLDELRWPYIRHSCLRAFQSKIPGINDEMLSAASSLIAAILVDRRPDDKYKHTVLVFVPGLYEIESLKKELEKQTFKDAIRGQDFKVHTLHSMLSTEEQKMAFVLSDEPKIILSTNIAESSITIPNVTHVVDFCLTKRQAILGGSSNRLQTLVMEWASRNHCKQRAGRTGRVCRGSVYRMVTKKFYQQEMREHSKPEILDISLESVILKVKLLDMGTPCEILGVSLDPPDHGRIVDAVLMLKELGGLLRMNSMNEFEFDDGEITYLGEVMAAIPCDVRISKIIMMGYMFSVLDEALIIGAGLGVQGMFKASLHDKMGDYKNKLRWADGSQSDLIAILNAYTAWEDRRKDKFFKNDAAEQRWCNGNRLDLKNLNEMR